MDVTDAEAFLDIFTGLRLPNLPNFLVITEADVYLSSGITVGELSYPAGFSFFADVLFCGAHLSATASCLNDTLKITGSLTGFKVGPLAVKGHNSDTASVDLEYGASSQHITIDGEIDFLNLCQVSVLLNLELQPTPAFLFDFALHFTPLLTFIVHAQMKGQVTDFSNLKDVDFDLSVTFEQHLLDYIHNQAIAQIEKAKKASTNAIDDASVKLRQANDDLNKDIAQKQQLLDTAQLKWTAKSQEVHQASQSIIDKYNARSKELQAQVDAEAVKFNLALKEAETKLQQLNADRAAKMQQYEGEVTKVKGDWDRDVTKAEADLHHAQTTFSSKFGTAEQDLANATNRVNSLQNQINDIQNKINDYHKAHWYEVWYVYPFVHCLDIC